MLVDLQILKQQYTELKQDIKLLENKFLPDFNKQNDIIELCVGTKEYKMRRFTLTGGNTILTSINIIAYPNLKIDSTLLE